MSRKKIIRHSDPMNSPRTPEFDNPPKEASVSAMENDIEEIQLLQSELNKTASQYSQLTEQYNLERKRSAELGSAMLNLREGSEFLSRKVADLESKLANQKRQKDFFELNSDTIFATTYSACLQAVISKGGLPDKMVDTQADSMANQAIKLTRAALDALQKTDLVATV